MEREIMPDYAAEEFYQYLMPKSFFECSERLKKEDRPRVVFLKKGCSDLLESKNQERALMEIHRR